MAQMKVNFQINIIILLQEVFGLFGHLLSTLKQNLNFSTELVASENRHYGGKSGNGSWSGLIGRLQRAEIDFSIMDITILQDRAEVC